MPEKFSPQENNPKFPDGVYSTDVDQESVKNKEYDEQLNEEDPIGLNEDYKEQTTG